jgi:putative acetyltransferase
MIHIITYQAQYAADFKRVNVEWISTFFKIEPHDIEQLDYPQQIIDEGGEIFLAQLDTGEIAGAVALVHDTASGRYELAKMGVPPRHQGLGIGRLLGNAVVARAKDMGLKGLFLETNSILSPAIRLYESLGFVHVTMPESTPYERANVRMELVF